MQLRLTLPDELSSMGLGQALSQTLPEECTVFMRGQLGVGKTTVVRAALRSLGVDGAIPSPTYTLAELYSVRAREAQHFDLYRLVDPEEFELIGARDFFGRPALRFIEWPENGEGVLPEPDVDITLSVADRGREAAIMLNEKLEGLEDELSNSLFEKRIQVLLKK